MQASPDADIAQYARRGGLALLTEDWGFADIRVYPPVDYFGTVFETSDNSVDEKLAALRNLLARPPLIDALRGRLAIVTSGRIRLRPPL